MGNAVTATKEAERTPVLRPRASVEELARLHPIERILYRVFEFMASVKLAVILMIWLMIECAIGTRIESTINASAAKYFVYGNTRFFLLLAILALNVLFAALIRYPWKRYQTGFLVTHIGLLILLAGSMVTSISYIDALLNVGQGEVSDAMIHPDRDVLHVSLEDPGTGSDERESVAVQFGPLTWGSKIQGLVPWRKGHEEVFPLDKIKPGARLRVKRFIAHCDWRETFVADKVGVPAVRFTLTAPNIGGFEQTNWVAAEPTQVGFMGDQQVNVGGIPVRVRIWRAGSQAEFDHFVETAPKGPIEGLIGELGFSLGGKHGRISVEKLQEAPFVDAETGARIEFVEYLPHAQLDPDKQAWKNASDDPINPALIVRVTRGGQTREVVSFANNPEFSRLLASRSGLAEGDQLTFFRADQPSEIQLLVTPAGQLGYRAFTNQACVASARCEMDQVYASFGMFQFIPREVLASGRPDLHIIPKPVPPGEQTFPAVQVEVTIPGAGSTSAWLVRRLPESRRVVDGRILRIRYEIQTEQLPFAVRLDDFNEPRQPGTMSAARYESFVTVFDKKELPLDKFDPHNPLQEKRGDKALEFIETRKAEIKMNHPLFVDGEDGREYTLYQSGIARPGGTPVSTYTVAYDPGLIIKYIGAVVLCAGIFLMFYMGGYFRKRAETRTSAAQERDERDQVNSEAFGAEV